MKSERFSGSVLVAAFILAAGVPFSLAAGSFEAGLSGDGAGRLSPGMFFSGGGWRLGGMLRLGPDGEVRGMGGLEGDFLCLGRLNAAGLAAEVRSPGASAAGRLEEETFFRADLRSSSMSRLGICLRREDRRAGAFWEMRENLQSGLIWASPFEGGPVLVDVLASAVLLSGSRGDGRWIPQRPASAGDALFLPALRLRMDPGEWLLGFSGMASFGMMVPPGGCGTLTAVWAHESWKMRVRAAAVSTAFRNLDGRRPDEALGWMWEIRRSPAKGWRFLLGLNGGWEMPVWPPPVFLALGDFDDSGKLSFGRRGEYWGFSAAAAWKHFMNMRDELQLSSGTLEVSWTGETAGLEVMCGYKTAKGWRLGLEGRFLEDGPVRIVTKLGVRNLGEGEPLWNFGANVRWTFGADRSHRLIFDVDVNDLIRDWRSGPAAASDLEFSIRWIYRFPRAEASRQAD